MKNFLFSMLLMLLFYPITVNAQIEDIKLTNEAVMDIYKLYDDSYKLTLEPNQLIEKKNSLVSLSTYSIEDIKSILEVLLPSKLRSKEFENLVKNRINEFVNDFWKSREESLVEMFQKNEISNLTVTKLNLKKLLENEVKLILIKDLISYQGMTYQSNQMIEKINDNYSYEEVLGILNQNIDDKAWDKKVHFVLNNAELKLFR